MYDTPSSRTSKHASSRKSHRNIRQNKARSRTPIEADTEHSDMDAPEETTLEEPKLGFESTSPEVREMKLEAEEDWSGQEALAVDGDRGGELSVLPPLSEPREDSVHVAFNPFEGNADGPLHDLADNPSLELHDESMPLEPSVEPATAHPAGVDEPPVEPAGPSFGALSDIAEHAQEAEESVSAHGRRVGVTGAETAPSAPPQRETARTRAPIFVPRSPSSPSTLSRQLQSVQQLLPSSPQLPSLGFSNPLANFAAPRISNVTVSGSSFNRPSAHPTSDPFVSAKEARRRSTGNFGERGRDRNRPRAEMTPQAPRPDDSDAEDILPHTTALRRTRYPSTTGGKDKVVYASFAFVSLSATAPPRRLLFIGYENGLQIWDTTHLGEVQEVLNRRLSGAVVGCNALPAPRPVHGSGAAVDAYADRRPLIGIVVEEHEASNLLVYSLATHEVIKKLDFSGATVSSFQASNSFIVVSTSSPTSLHILCSRSLNILHTIQSRQLATFSRPVSYQTLDGQTEILYPTRQDRPHPVFHLSSRLVAFASAPPSADSSLKHIYPRMALPQSPSIQLGPYNVSQADIGNAAMKVGGGLLSGMKALGGIAVAAARGESMSTVSSDVGGGLRKFFSRSAPAATSSPRHERRPSAASSIFGHSEQPEVNSPGRFVSEPGSPTPPSDSAHVTVLDLQPLLDDKEGRPERLTDFTLPTGQVVAGLKFSDDGTSLAVVPSDGGVVRLYQIKPRARALRRSAISNNTHSTRDRQGSGPIRQDSGSTIDSALGHGTSAAADAEAANVPWHVYDLRRGRTSGVIEALNIAGDGRWVGICTRKRTVHIFATNPYGGKPDEASHLEGKVKNISELQPLSTELRPIVRLRSNPVTPEQIDVPLAFTFVSSSSTLLPAKFLPSHTTFSSSSGTSSLPSSSPPKRRQQSVSPRLPSRPTNYQDILVFDPTDGSLSLRRLTISTRVGDSSTSLFSALPIPVGTSISLPGVGFIGRSSPSSPKAGSTVTTPQASSEQLPLELVAKDSTIATWNLARESKWSDVKVPVLMDRSKQQKLLAKSEWLAQAELSTYSRSTRILPSSIYLSHQFSFFALSEDYHALLHRWHFDIPVTKIEVRREVEANAYSAGQGESFVSAGTSPQDVRQARSTLDEPLASAIHSGLDYSGASPPVIPMFPNGARSGSFKASIPIRSVAVGITEGVTGSLGRLGRGIKKVRSPRLHPQSESAISSVPLEFDEDEALVTKGDISREPSTSREQEHDSDSVNDTDTASNSGGTRDSRLISTPSTNDNALLAGSESEAEGWGFDMNAVEEAEQFDEISAAGFMDEEQMSAVPPGFRASGIGQKRAGRKGR